MVAPGVAELSGAPVGAVRGRGTPPWAGGFAAAVLVKQPEEDPYVYKLDGSNLLRLNLNKLDGWKNLGAKSFPAFDPTKSFFLSFGAETVYYVHAKILYKFDLGPKDAVTIGTIVDFPGRAQIKSFALMPAAFINVNNC